MDESSPIEGAGVPDPSPQTDDPLLGIDEAAAQVGATTEGIQALVDAGVLVPEPGSDPMRFRASEVQAAHLAGG